MEGLAHVGMPLRASQMVYCVGIVNYEESAESFQGPGCCMWLGMGVGYGWGGQVEQISAST